MIPLLTLGLLTDTHYGPAPYGDRDCPGALDRLRVALEAFASAGISLVVNLGDAIDNAPTVGEELTLCAEVREACAAFPGQVRHVIGNHDVQMLSKEEFLAAMGCPPEPYYSFDAGGVHCAVLDGNCHQDGADFRRGDFCWDVAWISEEQLRWLADDLARAAGRPTLVFCHECLDDAADDPHVVRNAAAVRRLLQDAGVRAVFQGHYHPGRRRTVDGIPYVTLLAIAITGTMDECATVATLYADGSLRMAAIGG